MTAFDVQILGWLAAALTLATFVCRDMRRLRLLALAANAAFIGYGAAAQLPPVLMLHLALVPVNLWRLNQAFRPAPARSSAPSPAVFPGAMSARRRRPRSWRETSAIPHGEQAGASTRRRHESGRPASSRNCALTRSHDLAQDTRYTADSTPPMVVTWITCPAPASRTEPASASIAARSARDVARGSSVDMPTLPPFPTLRFQDRHPQETR
jgi:hypothetical protein